MTTTETLPDTPPTSPENGPSAERETVRDNINNLVDEIAERCPDCDGKMTLEAIEAYCQNCLDNKEKVASPFELTDPESKTYPLGEQYSFLIHVPLGDVEQRVGEIGSERGGVLMTSLINEQHQGTFCGEGGLLLEAPSGG